MEAGRPVVVAEARDVVEAQIWIDALRDAGIPATTFERGVGAALGGAMTAGWARYPVLVPQGEMAAARNVVAELGGAAFLAPVADLAAARRKQSRALLTVGWIVAVIVVLAVVSRLVAG